MSTIASHAVRISADTSAAENGLTGINKRFGDAKAGSMALLGGVVALGAGVAVFGKKCFDAYNIQATAEAKLIQLHHENTGATMAQTNELMKLASEVQKYGVIGDEAIISGQAQLSTFKMSTDAIKSLTPAMADMVAQQKGVNATGDDFVNIGNLIGKVMEGNIGALGRYGVSFDETSEKILKNGTETERAAELAKVLEANYGGVNKALRETPEGKIKALKDRFSDLQEGVGKMISKGMEPLLDSFGDWFTAIEDAGGLQEYLTEKFEENEKAIWIVTGAIMVGLVPALWAMAAGVWAVMAPLIPFLAIGAAVGLLLYKNWDKVAPLFEKIKEVLPGALEKAKELFADLWEKIQPFIEIAKSLGDAFMGVMASIDWGDLLTTFKELWVSLEPILIVVAAALGSAVVVAIGVLSGAIKGIIIVIKGLAKIIGGLADIVVGVFELIVGIFTGDGEKIKAAATKIWEGVKNIFSGAVDVIFGSVEGLITGIIDFFTGLWDSLVGHSIIPDMVNAIIDWFVKLKDRGIEKVQLLIQSVKDKFTSMKESVISVFGYIGDKIGDWITRWYNNLIAPLLRIKNRIVEVFNAIKDKVKSALDLTARSSPSILDLARGSISDVLKEYSRLSEIGNIVLSPSIAGAPALKTQPTQSQSTQSSSIHIGNITLPGVTDPESFIKTLNDKTAMSNLLSRLGYA